MAKIRVYELARELNLESKDLLAKLKSFRVEVAGHQSTLDSLLVDRLRREFAEKSDAKPKVVVRRRRRVDEDDSGAEAPAAVGSVAAGELATSGAEARDLDAGQAGNTLPEGGKEQVKGVEAALSDVPKVEPVSAPEADQVGAIRAKPQATPASSTPASFSGATIVRRATQAETEALAKRMQASRDGRPPVRSAPARPRQPSADSGSLSARDLLNQVHHESLDPGARYEQRGVGGKVRPRAEGAAPVEDEFARKARRNPKVGDERWDRSKLAVTPVSGEDDDTEAPAAPRRRTVYMPALKRERRRGGGRANATRKPQSSVPRAAYRVVRIEGSEITVSDLAHQLSIKGGEVVGRLMQQGVMATVNQTIDFDTASLIAAEYGYECKNVERTLEDVLGLEAQTPAAGLALPRPPVVTVMGHVDHGKTSILDAIRSAKVAAGESGGITQHIGAYQVERGGHRITFLDTPGHAAFSAMRSRGAQITDLVILVVAADDGVMPQTLEAISHAKNAGVPLIVAINKIDKPNINLDRVYSELSDQGVLSEEWGGDSQFVKMSALTGEGIDDLLDAIVLQSEVLELRAPSSGPARGVVLEAHLDPGRGPVATVLVTQGSLERGDLVIAGQVMGRVRAMVNERSERLKKAGPAMPVEIIGMGGVPTAGDRVYVVADEKTAREAAAVMERQQGRCDRVAKSAAVTLDELLGQVKAAERPQVNLIIKADTQGSMEAIGTALDKLRHDKVQNVIVHRGVGGVTESDVSLADTAGAIILGFHVRCSAQVRDYAEKRGTVCKFFDVIYELIDTVKSLMAGQLPPDTAEVILGHAQVRDPISVPRVGVIAGSAVTDGKIIRNAYLRLIRDDIVIYSGRVGSLRRFKDDVKEVAQGYECGISIDGYQDIKVGDVIEAFTVEEKAPSISFQES